MKDLSGLTGEGPTLHRIRSAGGVASIVDREGGREGDTLLGSIFFQHFKNKFVFFVFKK